MFCRHCGAQINDNAAVCVHCGVAVGTGMNFCPSCGAQTTPGAAVCLNCGVSLAPPAYLYQGQQKSKIAAGLLGIFLGCFGVHNFYLGYTGKGVAQLLLTLLSCGVLGVVSGVWSLIEAIMILVGSINMDANGVPLGN